MGNKAVKGNDNCGSQFSTSSQDASVVTPTTIFVCLFVSVMKSPQVAVFHPPCIVAIRTLGF